MSSDATVRIRELNDAFRQSFSGGRVVMTPTVQALPDLARAELAQRVRTFDGWTAENDPFGQHDAGEIDLAGATWLWRIDYHDAECKAGSPDWADPDQTTRVLTLMHISDW